MKQGNSADSGRHEAPGRASTEAVALKRAYEEHGPGDGIRVLVDRLWPRGLPKDQLAVDFWLKDLAPSDRLRRWYGHRPRRWPSFAAKYRNELTKRVALLRLLDQLRCRGRLTLLYGARDTSRNHAVVLREVLEERRWAAPRANEKRPEASAVR